MDKVKTTITSVLFVCLLSACAKEDKKQKLLFPEATTLSHVASGINDEDLASLEGIFCNDSLLLTYDFHSGTSYSLFNQEDGACLGRVGIIGQGPNELLRGTIANLQQNRLDVYNPQGFLASYSVDSLKKNLDAPLKKLTKMDIPFGNMLLHNLIPLHDSLFFGAGTYFDLYQYVLMNNKDQIVSYSTELYNAHDETFNKYSRMLSSAGRLAKAPNSNRFAYTLRFSENIDFLEIVDNKIKIICSHRERNPKYKAELRGSNAFAVPDQESSQGYINLTVGDSLVYTLYTEKPVIGSRSSDIIRVFDWEGTPVKSYKLDKEAYYIAVNESNRVLYAAVKNDQSGWSIVKYRL